MNETACNDTLLRDYLRSLSKTIGERNVQNLLTGKGFPRSDDAPFLSVIMRTQGKRITALREALLCLEAQTDSDFEVLLLGHNISPEDTRDVLAVVEESTPDLQARIRYIPVTGGTRTTPLMRGFSEAKGLYASIFDDDDIVFDHWVETFHTMAQKDCGKILHAYAVGQDWKAASDDKEAFLYACGRHENPFCANFELVKQLSANVCPTMSLAFPTFAYQQLGIHFDESLTTTEDWDFLMRTAFVCGVADSEEVTSIYRRWRNAESSATLHKRKEWDANRRKIIAKFNDYTVPIPLRQLCGNAGNLLSDRFEGSRRSELFIDDGNGFAGTKTAEIEIGDTEEGDGNTISVLNPYDYGPVRRLRFDPDDYGCLVLKDVRLHIKDEAGQVVPSRASFLRSNYIKLGRRYYFLSYDPQIVFVPAKTVRAAEIALDCTLLHTGSVGVLWLVSCLHLLAKIPRKGARLAYRTLKYLLHR